MRRRLLDIPGSTLVALGGITLFALVGVTLVASASAPESSQAAPGRRVAFVACPIVRDTATLPCWLAEYQGRLYYLGTQGSTSSAFYPPQLQHEVLVEAVVGEGAPICGGLPLTQVEVSVRPEINRACNTMLPAEPALTAPPSPAAPIPAFPDTTTEFRVAYDFDSDYLTLHTTRVIAEAARIAKVTRAASITLVGRRASTRLSDGQVLIERADLAEVRAKKMAEIFLGLGFAASQVQATWQADAQPADGEHDIANRALIIRLK